MVDDSLNRLRQIAGLMNRLQKKPNATLQYDLFAGAVLWSDERPQSDCPEDHWCLRPVFRYRTTLILGTPEDTCASAWNEAKKLFPRWPGFDPERQLPAEHVKVFYRRKEAEAVLWMDLLDVACRLQQEFGPQVGSPALFDRAMSNDPPDITASEVHQIVNAALSASHQTPPEDCWQRVQGRLAAAFGISPDLVVPESQLSKLWPGSG